MLRPALILITLLASSASFSAISLKEAQSIFKQVHAEMKPYLAKEGITVESRDGGGPDFKLTTWPSEKNDPDFRYRFHMERAVYEYPSMTKETFLHMVCHEFGHLVGGAPYINIKPEEVPGATKKVEWDRMSTEGQADFFSTSVCLKKVLGSKSIELTGMPPQKIESKCHTFFPKSEQDYKACLYSTVTSEKVIQIYHEVKQRQTSYPIPFPDLRTTSREVALQTIADYKSYPSLQCRLDTLVSGALCLNSTDDFRCRDPETQRIKEMRPRCWYAPDEGLSHPQLFHAYTRKRKPTAPKALKHFIFRPRK